MGNGVAFGGGVQRAMTAAEYRVTVVQTQSQNKKEKEKRSNETFGSVSSGRSPLEINTQTPLRRRGYTKCLLMHHQQQRY
jgi:hypothetical protein